MGCEEFDEEEELEKCIQEASLNDIIVVCSASNEGRRSSNTILFPARFGNVISVGSHDYLGHASNFTGVGREIDILGPGKLRSACPDHKTKVTNATSGATGTSFAAPFVAGIVAIILANAQRIGGQSLRSAISNNVVMKQILREMASEPGDHTQFRGHGSLDPLRIFDFKPEFFRRIVEDITPLSPPPAPESPSWSASSQADSCPSADRADINTRETADAAGAWVAATNNQDQWLMRDLGEVSFITGIITKGRNYSPDRSGGNHDQYVTRYTISYGDETGDMKFYTNAEGQVTEFPGNTDRDTEVINNFRSYSGPISARFIKIHPLKWQGHIAMRARIMAGGKHRLQEYDLRKVAVRFIPEDLCTAKRNQLALLKASADNQETVEFKHVPRPLEEDDMFSADNQETVEFKHDSRPLEEDDMFSADNQETVEFKHDSRPLEEDDMFSADNQETVEFKHVSRPFEEDDMFSADNQETVEFKHDSRPLELLKEDVIFSSRMDSINLSLPKVRKVQVPRKYSDEDIIRISDCQLIEEIRSLNLEVFCNKIKQDSVTEISRLSLPSPSDAAYGNKKGSAALTEFLTQLGRDLVSSVKDLWLEGGEDNLKFSDIKEILQTLQDLKSPDSRELTVHCKKVKFSNVTADTADCSYICQINPSILKVIIHPRDENWSSVFARVTAKIPNYVPACIEECSPVCCPHCSSVSKQAASCNQPGIEDMACDISLKKLTYASRDEMAAVHARILKHKDKLKGNVHVTVAVLGSGIYIDHELDKDIKVTHIIKDKACFVPQESWDLSVDTLGTGTALASIATSFAPAQTQLLTAKVMDEHGRSNPAWVARAVDWAANHGTYPADVILIPVGFEKFDHWLYKAVTEAQKNGKIVIAAAARNTEAREISYPARHGDVICVGSHSSFGVKGREMDFLMVGEKSINLDTSVSGTSVAAAMATAVVGFTLLYAESVAETPGEESLRDQLKSNTMIRELLREACSSRGFHTPDRGYGTLDPDRLFKWGPQHFKELVKKITGT
ncbi:hypothetical protein Bbelb_287990 [Branchiostoma belcheri]|nr:hypothetical protein Bbelb_287990 [Branchiostoma belcheri]